MKKMLNFLCFMFIFTILFTAESFADGPTYVNRHYYPDGSYSIISPVEITSPATWPENGSPYIVEGWIHIKEGGSLSIEDGAVVKFDEMGVYQQGIIQVESGASLNVNGSSSNGVVFTSAKASPAPGDWSRIEVQSGGYANINYATLEYGGQSAYNGAISTSSSETYVRNCSIQNSASNGIYLYDNISPTISDTNFSQNSGYAVYQTHLNADPILSNLSTDNEYKAIRIPGDYTGIDRSITWENPSIPYIVDDWIRIVENGYLNIQPGCVVKFNPLGVALQGNITAKSNGTLYADGVTFTSNKIPTPENPVAPGDWAYICGESGSTLRIYNSSLLYGGNWDCASLYVQTSDAVIENTVIASGSSHGIMIASQGITPQFKDVTINDNAKYGIYVKYSSSPSYSNITQSGNNKDGVLFTDGNIQGDVKWSSEEGPYYLSGWYDVKADAVLEMAPGTVVYFGPIGYAMQSRIQVLSGASLQALGDENGRVLFSSSNDEKKSGDWANIYVDPSGSASFKYCDFEYAGQWNSGVLNLASSNVAIENCRFSNSSSEAIRLSQNAAPYSISGNQFNIDIALYGINNTTPATTAYAQSNWWGHSSGPLHPSLNPSGLGVKVSDGVDFVPYMTSLQGDTDTDYVLLDSKSAIPVDKVWSIKFNSEVDESFVNSNYFYVVGSNGTKIQSTVSLSYDKKTVTLSPSSPYSAGESYYLYIKKGVSGVSGKSLSRTIKMAFTITPSL